MSSWLTNVVDKAAGAALHRKTRRSFLARHGRRRLGPGGLA